MEEKKCFTSVLALSPVIRQLRYSFIDFIYFFLIISIKKTIKRIHLLFESQTLNDEKKSLLHTYFAYFLSFHIYTSKFLFKYSKATFILMPGVMH